MVWVDMTIKKSSVMHVPNESIKQKQNDNVNMFHRMPFFSTLLIVEKHIKYLFAHYWYMTQELLIRDMIVVGDMYR